MAWEPYEEFFRMSYYQAHFWKSKSTHSKLSNDVSKVVIRPIVACYTHTRSSGLSEIHQCMNFLTFSHDRGVIQDELLLRNFLKIKKYTLRAFQWRIERCHTTYSHILHTHIHTPDPQYSIKSSHMRIFSCFLTLNELFRMSYYYLDFWKSKNIPSDLSNDVSHVIVRPLIAY